MPSKILTCFLSLVLCFACHAEEPLVLLDEVGAEATLSGRMFLGYQSAPDLVGQVQAQREQLIRSLQELQTAYCKAGMLDEALRIRRELRQLQKANSQELPQVTAEGSTDLLDLIRSPYQLRGRNGELFYIRATGTLNGSVWGSGPYTDDSHLGTAAIHAGVLKEGETKVIAVRILPGANSYQGGTANGITTSEYRDYLGSFEILGAGQHEDEVSMRNFDVNQESIDIYVTGRDSGYVWGNGIYTNDSDLGTAAVHAGLLKVGESALIRVEFLPGLDQYPAAERNGISSRPWNQWSTSLRLSRVVEQAASDSFPIPVEEERLGRRQFPKCQ